jgi:hypothetical protein
LSSPEINCNYKANIGIFAGERLCDSLALLNVSNAIDEQEAEHAISLNNTHKEDTGDADADYQRVAIVIGRRCSLIAKRRTHLTLENTRRTI